MSAPQRTREARRRVVREWMDSLHRHIDAHGEEATAGLLEQMRRAAAARGASPDAARPGSSPPINTISPSKQRQYPGDLEIEKRIEGLVRWNAAAMVVRGNREEPGLGGHISSFASAATLFEVGQNHFFRGRGEDGFAGDKVYFQGHASPGVYARAFLEGRLDEEDLDGFRRELSRDGLPSYPHPRCLPGFWEFPTVSMGLSPLMGVHQARFDRYLQRRGMLEETGRVWVLCGDGEMDEPESMAGLDLAAREGLGNLVFVVDCNLQRLDGPVRPNERIVHELEARFRGAGWNVVKVLWGSAWDELFAEDRDGELVARLERTVDGDWQRWAVVDPGMFRQELFGESPGLRELVATRSDARLRRLALARGGHDPVKVHAAYAAAVAEEERPTVVLAHTIKGYGLGEWGEGRNATHKRKDLDTEALRAFRDRFEVPVDDDRLEEVPYVAPVSGSAEARYLRERREELGGFVPARFVVDDRRELPPEPFAKARQGSGDREASTTMVLVRLLGDLLQDEEIGDLLVPIVPDEARTFGMEPLFARVGIHAPEEPEYEPVDSGTLTEYRETPRGQLLEEGITEAGSMASAVAAGTAHATHGLPCVPFYFFYSMFGFQRVGDLIWAAGDAMARGFLIGATSGRTTLNGEGLQHQDGHSHLLAMAHPGLRAYDTAFGYEVSVLVEEGMQRILSAGKEELYYLTVANQPYGQPPMPDGSREGIVRGLYRLEEAAGDGPRVRLLAAGPLVPEAMAAKEMLASEHELAAELWVVTSWSGLYVDALAAERDCRLRGDGAVPWIRKCLGDPAVPVVAVSDFVQHLPHTLSHWLPGAMVALGTHGFGRSDTRAALRSHFEIDRRHVAQAALFALERDGELERGTARRAAAELGIEGAADAPYPPTTGRTS